MEPVQVSAPSLQHPLPASVNLLEDTPKLKRPYPERKNVRCGAKVRGLTALDHPTCKANPIAGSKRCRMHGGKAAQLPPGHPKRGGGVPANKRTGVYAQYLLPDEKADFDAVAIGNVDDDVRIAKTKLAWALKQWKDNPTGGVVSYQDDKGNQRIQPWYEIVLLLIDRVQRLEKTKKEISAEGLAQAPVIQIAVINQIGTLPPEALKQYAETGVLDATAWANDVKLLSSAQAEKVAAKAR